MCSACIPHGIPDLQEVDSGQKGETAQKELRGREWPRSVEQCRRRPGAFAGNGVGGLDLVREGLGWGQAALDGSQGGWLWMCEEQGGGVSGCGKPRCGWDRDVAGACWEEVYAETSRSSAGGSRSESKRGGKVWAQNWKPGFGPGPATNQLDHWGQVSS